MEKFCWLGNGDGVVEGVALLGGLETMGVSFQFIISFVLEGGGAEGVVFLGGPAGGPVGGPPKD